LRNSLLESTLLSADLPLTALLESTRRGDGRARRCFRLLSARTTLLGGLGWTIFDYRRLPLAGRNATHRTFGRFRRGPFLLFLRRSFETAALQQIAADGGKQEQANQQGSQT
jgi:hypothetical protein